MKIFALLFFLLTISGCAANPWSVQKETDEFTDKTSCRVTYGSDFGRDVLKSYLGGIYYAPFIEKVNGEVIFGIRNDYNIPVGDVQIRIDENEAILISYTETPIFYAAAKPSMDFSYMTGIDGINTEAMNTTMAETINNISKISSPFTATSGGKAKLIINQIKSGSRLKMRVIGFGTNSALSNTGEYSLGNNLKDALIGCGI